MKLDWICEKRMLRIFASKDMEYQWAKDECIIKNSSTMGLL
jgi:hypothetical protein